FTQYEYDITATPNWIGLANFQRLWTDKVFWQTLGNTLLYLIGVVPPLIILPLGLAILVNRKLRGINWFRTAFYTPVVISMVVAGIAWKALYQNNGIFNQWLKQIATFIWQKLYQDQGILPQLFQQLAGGLQPWLQQLMNEGIPWLTSPNWAIWSVMVVTIWKGLGYYMVIYLAGLQSISPELYEAAAIDGSDGWRKHLDITLPLMRPYLFLVGVISAISASKVFEEIYIMTQGGPRNSSKTIVYYLYEQAFTDLDISYGCTMGLVLFLVIFILSIFNWRLGKNTTR
ncbi:MAG: sugar ABC transporter permease, partial [Cyanobacteria bacterium J083]